MLNKDKLKIGVIGLSKNRGYELIKTIGHINNAEVCGICDLFDDYIEDASKLCEELFGRKPYTSNDYEEFLSNSGIDAVIISVSWELHVDIAVSSMEKGIITGLEVGGGYDIAECWRLVRTYEKTRTPFMFMENCCFDRAELLSYAMAKKNMFGEIVHVSGAYAHDLRKEIFYGLKNRHYRYRNYLMRNGDTYPTHELGPLAKILGIQRGNRMVSLVSIASKARGLNAYADKMGEERKDFSCGDIINTIITCAGGETIALKLDTTLPTVYDRAITVRGTKGLYIQSINCVYFDGDEELENLTCYSNAQLLLNNASKYEDRFLPPEWKSITQEEIKTGHGGMDLIMLRRFVDCALNGKEMPIDVYDAAVWMCISCLSEKSVKCGGMPQSIPDFTGGKWLIRKPKDVIDMSYLK